MMYKIYAQQAKKLKAEADEILALLKELAQRNEADSVLVARNRQKLKRIEAALIRITDRDYGFCLRCRAEIRWSRLHVLPYAELCWPCQRKQEQETMKGSKD